MQTLECNLADLLLATITFGALSASFFSPELNLDPHVCSQGAVSRVFHCPHCSVFSRTTVHKFPHTSTNCPIPQPELLRKENLFYGDVCATKMQGIISENESHSWQKVCFILARTWLCVIFMGWQSLDTSPPHIILDLAKPGPPSPGKQHFQANLKRNLNLAFPPSTSQHSCILGFQETLEEKKEI